MNQHNYGQGDETVSVDSEVSDLSTSANRSLSPEARFSQYRQLSPSRSPSQEARPPQGQHLHLNATEDSSTPIQGRHVANAVPTSRRAH